jgi:DNA-binding MltR family transcriptional regulator
MGGGGRGVKKPKLRDYTIRATPEEIAEIRNAITSRKDPLTCAILGGVMVEHELDKLLRRKFVRKDDDTWERLVGDKGPLSSFNSKIITGRAFKVFDDKTEHDLNVLREIRNTFAHARKLLLFNDPLIVNKLRSAKLLAKRDKTHLEYAPFALSTFIILCYQLAVKLTVRLSRQQKAAARRRLKTSSIAKALFGNVRADWLKSQELQAKTPLSLPGSHSGGPMLATLPPLMGGLLGLSLDKLGKKDD